MQNIKSRNSFPEAGMFDAQEIDHRAIFLDLAESQVRSRGMSKAFGLGSGLLMRPNPSVAAQDALEEAVADHLRRMSDVVIGTSGMTADGYASVSLAKTSVDWWLVTFPMSRSALDIRGGDIYFTAEQVAQAFEDFDNEGYEMQMSGTWSGEFFEVH